MQNFFKIDIAIMGALIIAPANMHTHAVRGKTFRSGVQRLHIGFGDLDELLIEAHEGKQPVSPEVAAYILEVDSELEKEAATPFDGLTPKEREVVQMIARGYTYRESATRLDMKVKTLETHMSNIFRKLGVATRHHLSTLAFKLGFVDLTDDDYEDGSTGG